MRELFAWLKGVAPSQDQTAASVSMGSSAKVREWLIQAGLGPHAPAFSAVSEQEFKHLMMQAMPLFPPIGQALSRLQNSICKFQNADWMGGTNTHTERSWCLCA